MIYTILSAQYCNPEKNAAIIETKEAYSVAISEKDTPDIWQQMLDFGNIKDYND